MHAVFTIVQDDPIHLRMWGAHYRRFYPAEHIYVLHHPAAGEPPDAGWVTDVERVLAGPDGGRAFHVVPVFRDESFDHEWLRETVQAFQRFLLQSYATVLFTEIDEVVATDPVRFDGTLRDYCDGLTRSPAAAARCTGFEVVHDVDAEPRLDWARPLLRQRSLWYRSSKYCKTLLAKVPLTWDHGFHAPDGCGEGGLPADPDPRLLLLHLHKVDWTTALERHRRSAAKPWPRSDVEARLGWQNQLVDKPSLRAWWFASVDTRGERANLVAMPDHVKDIV